MIGKLVLEDGAVLTGKARGAQGCSTGEVVFNTGMTGFQEILTDPSYCGQIITMTYPLIGNYGIAPVANESRRPYARGFIVREICNRPSHWRSGQSLDSFLREHNIICLEGVDTRALTRRIREHGTMKGIICSDETGVDELLARMRAGVGDVPELVREVTTQHMYRIAGPGPRVVVMDFGCKENILRRLHHHGCDLTVVPAWTKAAEILSYNPDGIFLSNGPGDPKDVPYALETIKELIGRKPVFGICLGHQLLALAFGADTYKLKFGHRGANHPVKDLISGRVNITSQNHGYSVDEQTMDGCDLVVTHRGLNDNTVEGMRHRTLPVFSVQYHPEAAPGPQENEYLFSQFMDLMTGGSKHA
ncbi:MAG TPA: glutamine-hydrolyzing carbamoyl-phosphate synthase small subunit [Negativicutes bacterium]|nr:glutamine-hydrolyzing carbamoyl-phosphate synthase small subunit [Negativicutes bacterium]